MLVINQVFFSILLIMIIYIMYDYDIQLTLNAVEKAEPKAAIKSPIDELYNKLNLNKYETSSGANLRRAMISDFIKKMHTMIMKHFM